MITALQHFISKKGKFVFILLLLLVIVSFVLYLSQGSSVFDLISDGGREKKEFYGYNWNDPDQRRYLNVTTRAAGSVGVLLSPAQDVVEQADNEYIQGLQQQIQAAFRANPEEVDQDALQRMFQYMQAWPNFPRDFKVREIARSGQFDAKFLDESIKTRVLLSGQADNWDFMDGRINHPSINSEFIRFLSSIDPSLESESNRTQVLSVLGGRFGMTGSELESVLYSSFRDTLVDRIYTDRGFALSGEVDVLSQQNAFAWDGEVGVLSREDLPKYELIWGHIDITGTPKAEHQFVLFDGVKNHNFVFGAPKDDANKSVIAVTLGENPKQAGQNLIDAINRQNLLIQGTLRENSVVTLELKQGQLPKKAPKITSKSKTILFKDELSQTLLEFFNKNNDLDAFMEESRTFATAMVFPSKNFLSSPAPADEARLRSYFERNRLDFLPESVSSEKPDNNETDLPEVNFADVADDVRKKVEAQDLADAKREAERLAQDAALEFLDNLNTLSDKVRRLYPDFVALRNSTEMTSFLKGSGAEQRKVAFASKDMNVQSMVLGLERRASEQRSNKDPLVEVESLTETKFFTRSVRKSRNGYIVFLLDRKTPKKPAELANVPFSTVCQEHIKDRSNTLFNQKIDEITNKLSSNPRATDDSFATYIIKAQNQTIFRASSDAKQRTIRSKIDKLENGKNQTKDIAKTANSQEEKKLKNLRAQLEELAQERKAVDRLFQGIETLNIDGAWSELERNEEGAVFGLLTAVYSVRGKEFEEEQRKSMNTNLELSRGMLVRDEVIKELVSLKLSE